ncbi:50S ribosomal protein L15 [Candidatus Beckwithbacteria bacterium CG22_combo_CG10-13_8_21_14_all_01_47_9]|uniref:50S ribosomal protein L15 n=5 Tax=Candidatus Beckwithiibacteriota TaxID=1752726 RepID=A0A2H0E2F0_9BACT|nr:MAG: 50S ribosomal protein L15 [Candidatus Beckwithbacteria bacterium CG1_02_47_37]PIP52423.1 MAG: 50S ribosomal protein L15 [Candidatus Beckwithbacteria bacterium CG23_combo_of_CG06-09_8_20_14_all_47_9]PIP87990.1 MAG: 50S ribosomal protein L15 [Candidatus Beckwithbacteria bacterium CG22_combo_CG10-13_8_21_14_all_01_47_9]PJA22056.1 MAG: 50S ribosomal protein L15 [Candidatus Beckwithbacteria bacterium CG_4_10_14_0_2_um_filter_47_25]PJC66519.1 MAG: 50S ribosomal protein L15 [Candidatus Beckwit
MKLEKISKTTTRPKKRLGRGYGSGKGGHTSSRGQKGQKSRGKLPLYFEGSKMRKSLIRRLPMLRGKLRNQAKKNKPVIFNLRDFADWPKATPVTVESLVKAGWVSEGASVKLLGEGELKEKLKIDLPMSKSAAKKVND